MLRVLWPWHALLRAALMHLDASLGAGALRVLLLAPWSLGLSGAICIASDLLGLCSLHVLYLYRAARSLYAAHLAMLNSMYNLFRGRKYNLLRQRTDSCDYDLEQQLLGTRLHPAAPMRPACNPVHAACHPHASRLRPHAPPHTAPCIHACSCCSSSSR